MTISQAVITGILAIFAGAGGSLVSGFLRRPKTRAEADNLETAGVVSMSAEAREWARDFAAGARQAQERAEAAEVRAEKADNRVDELEASLIECYGYVRQLREQIRQLGNQPPPLPSRLEVLWENGH
jgi:folate-dependent phosphoribosylglycinamide formyltransferase PurN